MASSSYRRSRYNSRSPSPRYQSRSRSRSLSRSKSLVRHYRDDDSYNPGNNLYITGLSSRVTERDLEEYCSSEGKVLECHLVVDPRTKESRGFGFVTMDSVDSAERCIKHLNKSVLEGRVITVEKAKRKRARTPTPGKYLGIRSTRGSSSYDYDSGRGYSGRCSPEYSPYRATRHFSPDYSSYRGRDRSYSPSYSPYRGRSRDQSYSPPRSPYRGRNRDRSYSPCRSYRDRSLSREYSPYRRSTRYRDRSPSPYYSHRGSRRDRSAYRSPLRRYDSPTYRSYYRSRSYTRSRSPY